MEPSCTGLLLPASPKTLCQLYLALLLVGLLLAFAKWAKRRLFVTFQAQFIAQSIGQAFQVAYVEFLKANGIEDSSFVKEMDYQEVLNSQEIFNNELALFSSKERQKEVT